MRYGDKIEGFADANINFFEKNKKSFWRHAFLLIFCFSLYSLMSKHKQETRQ